MGDGRDVEGGAVGGALDGCGWGTTSPFLDPASGRGQTGWPQKGAGGAGEEKWETAEGKTGKMGKEGRWVRPRGRRGGSVENWETEMWETGKGGRPVRREEIGIWYGGGYG